MTKLKEYWGNSPKWARILFWVFLGISTALIVGSFFVPPMGSIDPSVLQAVGEIQGFAALGVGFECIFTGMNVSLEKGDTKINVSSEIKEK
jgi:hypothetical protein